MTDKLVHRGPDDSGAWCDEQIALGHRRLSIIDLSSAGHQPMVSPSGRYVMVFNGEIYNHCSIRAELEDDGYQGWRGHSDTETILASIERWGLTETLQRSVGMFAIALWDKVERRLSLARDRMGEKPLYYGRANGAFMFASELRPFWEFPNFSPVIDRDVLALFFKFNYVPTPKCIFAGFNKLSPGAILHVNSDGEEVSEVYWSLNDHLSGPRFKGTPEDAVEELHARLAESVKLQSIADVPLGAFLSGGVDSSTIVALMQRHGARPVKTFTIGFHEKDYSEAHFAAAVAQHLGTDHTEMTVSSGDALAVIPRLPEIWDEPFADSSQLPTFIVARLAKQKVTVSLSGDGGDELFCGYERYFSSHTMERYAECGILKAALNTIPHSWIEKAAQCVPLPQVKSISVRRLRSVTQVLNMTNPRDRYLTRVSQWKDPTSIVNDSIVDVESLSGFAPAGAADFYDYVSSADAKTYLPDDILVKVDRAAMASSLETRVPLLDHRIVELAFSLPSSFKVRNGEAKWPLRQVLYRHVPRSLIDRPKRGFGVPVADWLRGPLRGWADDLLSESSLARGGLLNPRPIIELWKEHRSGIRAWENRLWGVLMFQAWRERYGL